MPENETMNKAVFEINALKSLLRDSDYQIIKLMESFTDCTTATGIIKAIKDFATEFGGLVKSRREWRARINELEAEIATQRNAPPDVSPQ